MSDTTIAPSPVVAPVATGATGTARRRREAINGYLFVAPSIIGFVVFILLKFA